MDVRDEISRDKRKSKVESSAAGESVKKTSGLKKSFVKAKGKGKANPSIKPKPPVIPNPPVKLKEHLAKVKLAKETKPNAPSKPKVLVKPNQTKPNQTKPKVSVEEGSDEDGEEKGSESEEDGEKEVSDDGEDGGSESEEDGEEEREEEGSDDGEDRGSEEDEEYEGSEDEVEDGEDEGDGEESDEDEGVDNRSLVLFKGKCRNVSGSKKRKQFSDEKSGLKHKKNVSKDKKMKHVFEEKKVSKRKKKHESSSSSSEDEKPMKKKERLSKPKSESSSKSKKEKRKDSKKKMKKPLTEEEKKRLAYLNKFKPMKSRTVPKTLFAAIRDSRVDMESFLSGIGFSSLYNISMDTMPSRLARFVVSSFDSTSYEFKLAKGKFVVTSKKVHEILGIPLGGKSLFDLPERSPDDPFMKKWFDQFGNRKLKEIHLPDLASVLVGAKKVDFIFKVNFLMLFVNTMCVADTMKGILNLTVVKRIREDTVISEIDWCGFLHNCLQYSQLPNTDGGYYIGPIAFLILLYLDSTKFDSFPVVRVRPAIKNWNTFAMKRRQDLELKEQVIGKLELNGEWTENEARETEGFVVGDSVRSRPRLDSFPPGTDKQSFYQRIEEKLSIISHEKHDLEVVLKHANLEFPGDENVVRLYEKYVDLFKETVSLDEEQVHVDDFSQEDHEKNEGGPRKEDLKKGPTKDGGQKDGGQKDGGPKDGQIDDADNVDGGEKDGDGESSQDEEIIEVGSFTQWLEENYDVGLPNDDPQAAQADNIDRPRTPEGMGTRRSYLCSPNLKKRAVKPSPYLCSPYMNKKTVVITKLKKLEFMLGNSLFAMQGEKLEKVFESHSGDFELSSVRLNMETLAPSLWVDSNVVDCWGAILNYEERFKEESSPWRHFFPTGCLTNAMVNDPRLDEDQHWEIFSKEIEAQLRKDDATLSLVELAFFPVCVSNHFYVVVFNLKKQTTMTILDNSDVGEDAYKKKYKKACDLLKKLFSRYLSVYEHPKHASVAKVKPRCPRLKWRTQMNHIDCGVFAMMHMEAYMGQAASKWDVGLCAESEQQKSLLKRMRFKIATKILLHEENAHAQKMYDFANRFDTEYDDATKISIIVDAIRNRGQRESQE